MGFFNCMWSTIGIVQSSLDGNVDNFKISCGIFLVGAVQFYSGKTLWETLYHFYYRENNDPTENIKEVVGAAFGGVITYLEILPKITRAIFNIPTFQDLQGVRRAIVGVCIETPTTILVAGTLSIALTSLIKGGISVCSKCFESIRPTPENEEPLVEEQDI